MVFSQRSYDTVKHYSIKTLFLSWPQINLLEYFGFQMIDFFFICKTFFKIVWNAKRNIWSVLYHYQNFLAILEQNFKLKHLFFPNHTVRNLHFLSKNSTLNSQKNCRYFLGWKTRENVVVGLFSCWQLWFYEKNCKKKFGWKTRENVRVLSKLNFWTKIWLFE